MMNFYTYSRKAGKGIEILLVDNVKQDDAIERMFCLLKTRKEQYCEVTKGIIEKGSLAYKMMPNYGNYISSYGMYLLKNKINPDLEEFQVGIVAKNIKKLYDKMDRKGVFDF